MNRYVRVVLLSWSQAAALAVGVALATQALFAAEEAPEVEKADADQPKVEEKADEKAEEKADETADEKAEEKKEEPTEFRNWFDVSVGGVFVDGDKGAFQRRYGLPAGAFGGVQDFHYEQDVGKKGLFKVDGHGIFDNHDYSLKFDVAH